MGFNRKYSTAGFLCCLSCSEQLPLNQLVQSLSSPHLFDQHFFSADFKAPFLYGVMEEM